MSIILTGFILGSTHHCGPGYSGRSLWNVIVIQQSSISTASLTWSRKSEALTFLRYLRRCVFSALHLYKKLEGFGEQPCHASFLALDRGPIEVELARLPFPKLHIRKKKHPAYEMLRCRWHGPGPFLSFRSCKVERGTVEAVQ